MPKSVDVVARLTRNSGLFWLLLLVLVVPACENGGIAPSSPATPARLIVVSGDSQTVTVASELSNPVVVRVIDSAGTPLAGQLVTFRALSGSIRVGSSVTDDAGLARDRWTIGTTAGRQHLDVIVTDSRASVTPTISTVVTATALPGAPSRLSKLSGDDGRLPAGGEARDTLVIRIADQYGNVVPGVAVDWSIGLADGTLNPMRSTTDSLGLARTIWTPGAHAGPTQVIATVNSNMAASFALEITPAVVASVTLAPGSMLLQTGDTARFSASLRDAFGNIVTGRRVAWNSGNPSVATVDSSGMLRANGAGRTVITASVDGKNATATVDVAQPRAAVASVTITPGSASLSVGAVTRLSANVLDAAGNMLSGRTVTWETSNASVAIVDAGGLVMGNGIGHANITATSEGRAGTAEIFVTAPPPPPPPPPPAAAALTIVSGSRQAGAAATELTNPLVVKVYDAASGQPLPDRVIRWRVSAGGGTIRPDTTITDASGLTQSRYTVGIVAGTTPEPNNTIVARIGTDSVVFLESTIPGPIASFRFLQHVYTLNKRRPCVLMSAAAFDRFGNVVALNPSPPAVSSDPAIIQIVRSGDSNLACPVHTGTAQITVQAAGFADTAVVVYRQVTESVVWSGHSDVLRVGAKEQLSGFARDSSGAVVEGKVAHWSSSNSGVVSVDSSGLVSAVGRGRATVSASIDTFRTAYPYLVVAQSVTTLPATSVARTSATLNGTVTPDSVGLAFQFIYGRDPTLSSYDGLTPVQGVNPGASVTVNENVTGLIPGVVYYYRIQAYSGPLKGDVLSFTTPP